MAAGAATAAAVVAALLSGGAGTAEAATTGQVRVNQVGYDAGGAKEAFLLAKGTVSGATWTLLDSSGATAATGRTGTSQGSWNTAYPAVYLIDFSSVKAAGTYHLVVSGAATGASPTFTIGSAKDVYAKPAADATAFFQAQRDGRDIVPGSLKRQPSHLNDAHATVYDWPTFTSGDGDTISKAPAKLGGTVDAEGGWFDAGDYLKFTETTTYAAAALQIAARETGASPTSPLGAEAQHGLDWLDKMWDGDTKTLYIQVGLGSGTDSGSVVGDHDTWRLPQKDDSDTAHPFLRNRPVFRAGAPGSKLSPNQAGRLAADFALGAQRYASSDPAKAKGYLAAAAQVYALADTHPGKLVTTVPYAYYPETSWQDDLALGGAELALAAQRLGDSRAAGWLQQSAAWAKAYGATGDTLNMYDTSALAYADLARAIKAAGNPAGLPVTYDSLVANLKAQIASGQARAAKDPFHAGAVYNDFDADSHTLGLAATTRLYRGLTGDTSVDRFAVQQLDWLLGANAWGTSFMVGEGSTYPKCTAGQLGNLAGSLDGKAPLETGAIVNGPNGTAQFADGLGDYLDGMHKCQAGGADPFGTFTGHGSRYVDDVRSWQSSEPALDMDASGLLAFYLSS